VTANVMAKIAHGISDDLLTNLVLARDPAKCPLAIAPAMNVQMWAILRPSVIWHKFVRRHSYIRSGEW